MRKRIMSILLTCTMLLSLMPTSAYAWETETNCEYCGKFIADDWICDGGDHCSVDADGGCYDEHHCSGCGECVDELCEDCNLCDNCDNHCSGCDECVYNVDLCEECGYCSDCAVDNGYHCPDCNVCKYEGVTLCSECGRCGSCGGECGEGIETCGLCFECHAETGKLCLNCKKCFMDDDSDLCTSCQMCRDCVSEWCDTCGLCVECAKEEDTHCEDCGLCLLEDGNSCPECGKCKDCAESNVNWCDDCGMCVECAIKDTKHCSECEACFLDAEQCLVCNRCLECGGGMCSDHHTELCMECHLDMGKACRQCNKCYGDESEDTAACSECGRCADCVGEDICPNCHMCRDCAEDQGKHCKNCGRCEADVDVLCANCGLCGDCGGECSNKCADMCLECHVDSENACPDCGKCYILGGGVGHVGCTECYLCDECTPGICEDCSMCLECAAEQNLHCLTCYECHENVEICEECKEVCENCADAWCENCHMCLECAKDQKEHCPDCGACGDDVELCSVCGKCEFCSDEWCGDCGICLECHDSSKLCAECGNICIANGSPCSGHCEDCFDELKCPECEQCSVCEDLTLCEDCGMCVECAVGEKLHCPECGEHYNRVYIRCDTCNMCTDCAFYNHNIRHCDNDCGACEKAGDELCPKCGWCKDCQGDDWCDTCHKCLSTCHEENEVCGQCGDCFAATGKTACPECGNCTDCCKANSKAAGCDHGVCIKSENWESHWNTEHAGKEHTHVYVWYYGKDWHYKQCMVKGCPDNMTEEEPHRYGDWAVVLEPTETTEGMRSRVCRDCGRCDEETISRVSHTHNMTLSPYTAPTCTAGGTLAHYTCASCGKLYSDKDGTNELTISDVIRPALEHDYQWIIDRAATAAADGLKHRECTRCRDRQPDVVIPAIGAHEHTYNSRVVPPTCTAQGYTVHICTQCGLSYTDTITAALGHTDADRDRRCDSCGASLSSGAHSGSNAAVPAPRTFDGGIGVYILTAAFSFTGLLAADKKSKEEDEQ